MRVDSHIYSGYTVPPYYDSMIAKLIASGQSREECIDRMARALYEMIIEGVQTTLPLHMAIMKDKRFRAGDFSTRFLDDFNFSSLDD